MSELVDTILEDEIIRILRETAQPLTSTEVVERITGQRFYTVNTYSQFNRVWEIVESMIDQRLIIRHPTRTLELKK